LFLLYNFFLGGGELGEALATPGYTHEAAIILESTSQHWCILV